jgi:hypothetical protein
LGGKIKHSNYSVLSDLEIYSIDEKVFRSPLMSLKNKCKPRRNHIAELVGHQIFFHGGFNEDNIVQSDSYLLSLDPLKWNEVIVNESTSSPSLAGHSSCLVLSNEVKNSPKMNIYKLPEERTKRAYEKVQFL